jgi:hypothetical protein
MADIMKKAHDFPPSVAGQNAAPFAVSLADYKALALPNDRFNFIDIQNQRDVLAEHGRKRFEFLTCRNSISYIRQHPGDFVGADDAKLAEELRKITDAINTMEHEASACLRDASKCNFTPFDISDFPLPPAKRAASLEGVWEQSGSGHGSSKWTFTQREGNQYDAAEEGLGAARGIAVVNGLSVVLTFQASVDETTGRYSFQLNSDFTSGSGTIAFFTVHTDLGILHNFWTRLR